MLAILGFIPLPHEPRVAHCGVAHRSVGVSESDGKVPTAGGQCPVVLLLSFPP